MPMIEDFGPIAPYLASPDVSEIMVNGPGKIFIEQAGKLIQLERRFPNEGEVLRVIRQLLAVSGKNLSPQMPLMDLRLNDGSRMTITMPPVTPVPSFTIRRPSFRTWDLLELVKKGTMSAPMAEFLRLAIHLRLNMIIAGGTSTGKTTLLNAMAALIPRNTRIVTIEDTFEISLPHPNWLQMETVYQGRGEKPIDTRDLVAHSLHLRPDRIILGECRGGEALDILQAMCSGHDGSMATIHASSPRDALSRLETMALMSGYEIPLLAIRQQIGRAIDMIVHMVRTPDGARLLSSVTAVSETEPGSIVVNDIYVLNRHPVSGRAEFRHTGFIPPFIEKAIADGVQIPATLFEGPPPSDSAIGAR